MKVERVFGKEKSGKLTCNDLEVGDIGVAEDEYVTCPILATYDGLVELEDPSNTYSQPCMIELVKILKKGDSIILTIE